MSLFECSKCHAVENTACCNYHGARMDGTPLLCSECDPTIGKWHGRFPKKLVSETTYVTNANGTLEPPGGWK